jgi:chaperonin GroES
MTQIIPLAGYVLVKRQDDGSTPPGGIIITQDNKEKPQKGEVLAVGAAKEGQTAQVAVGQIVLFKKYGPTEIEVDGEDVLLLEEEDILAIYQA